MLWTYDYYVYCCYFELKYVVILFDYECKLAILLDVSLFVLEFSFDTYDQCKVFYIDNQSRPF